jgi:hypothetical protein
VTTATLGRALVPRRLVSEARAALLARIDSPEAKTDFHLFRYSDPVLALQRNLPHSWRTGTMADPQILIHRPHTGPEPQITYHVDETPEWVARRAPPPREGQPEPSTLSRLTGWADPNRTARRHVAPQGPVLEGRTDSQLGPGLRVPDVG